MNTRAVKQASTFFPEPLRHRVRQNVMRYAWAKETARILVEAAMPWRQMSNDALWALMFGPTITRSWHVWSSGYCPACKQPVPMYNWLIDPWKNAWKVQCPHCKMLFPTNDFDAYYRSGLDEHGIFDPKRADRSLLFHTQHPDPKDPLHRFGVDDGEGYVEGESRWRFIGAYLVYGQWKGMVLAGIKNLAAAYLVTEDPIYARKAGILLDRVADLYPQFDHKTQAVVYETVRTDGYVSTWHDACEETRLLAMAYDAVFDALRTDRELVQFLSQKAKQHRLSNPKATFADIQRNIEQGLLVDPLRNEHKITSNFPRTPFTKAVLLAVQGYGHNRDAIQNLLNETLKKATAVDGVTGEKGIAGYSAFAVRAIGDMVATFDRVDAGFLRWAVQQFPLRDTFRFHLDTWALQRYYPLSGDTGVVAHRIAEYAGVSFLRLPSAGSGIFSADPVFSPSMFTFFWRLYELTTDVDFVRLLYRANAGKVDGLPHDLFAEDPGDFQHRVKQVITRHGAEFRQASVNKSKWHLAILRSGKGERQRVVWLDYDAGGGHGHEDAMNLGMFAFGLDLMPDFGYPPVQYGGWTSPQVRWYFCSQAHNTVVVDGKTQSTGDGTCTLWCIQEPVQVVRASASKVYGIPQYERTVILVDISPQHFYVLDIFRVGGGSVHDRFLHGYFGRVEANGALTPASTPPEHTTTLMRQFMRVALPDAQTPLRVDWHVEDRFNYLPKGKQITLRCIDLTTESEPFLCEGWVAISGFSSTEEAWIPRLMVRRHGSAPLASTFVAVLAPFEGKTCPVKAARRLPLHTSGGQPYGKNQVAVEVNLANGDTDLIIAMDVENALRITPSFRQHKQAIQRDWGVSNQSDILFVRKDSTGRRKTMLSCA
ncbi:MAG: heparinase II/III family protein [Armatimonadota bacterium]|nr:heparinase II/III family protein [Armatimonadota bacterium]